MTTISSNSGGTGVLVGMSSLGQMDQYLKVDPEVTFFKRTFARASNFAMELVSQPIQGNVVFGREFSMILNRVGDKVGAQFLRVTCPGISSAVGSNTKFQAYLDEVCDPLGDGALPACTGIFDEVDPIVDQTSACTDLPAPPVAGQVWYTNHTGHAMLKSVQMLVGGQQIDKHYRKWMHIFKELTIGTRDVSEMLGSASSFYELLERSKQTHTLYIPLYFTHNLKTQDALSMVALQFHQVQFNFGLAPIGELIQMRKGNPLYPAAGPPVTANKPVVCTTGADLTDSDFAIDLLTNYIYLDQAERDVEAAGGFETLISQVQQHEEVVTSSKIALNPQFNHAVKSMHIIVQRDAHTQINNHFNFSGPWGQDGLVSAEMTLNGSSRFNHEAAVLRNIMPYLYWPSPAKTFHYNYSYAVQPWDVTPSGSVNHSRIDTQRCQMQLHPSIFDVLIAPNFVHTATVSVFANSGNVFRVQNGLGGLVFAS